MGPGDEFTFRHALGEEQPSTEECRGAAAMRRLANSGTIREHLPGLEIIIRRASEMMNERLLQMLHSNLKFQLNTIDYGNFGDAMWSLAGESIIAIVRAEELDGSFLIAADRRLMSIITELRLGGQPTTVPEPAESEQRLTTIEARMFTRTMEKLAGEIARAFESVVPLTLSIERLETNPQFTSICRWSSATVNAALAVDVAEPAFEASLQMIFPYAIFEPVKPSLTQIFRGEGYRSDAAWEDHFRDAVLKSKLDMTVVLHEEVASLADVMSWGPGKTLTFDREAEKNVRVVAGEDVLLSGELGRNGKRLAISVEKSTLSAKSPEPAPRQADTPKDEAA